LACLWHEKQNNHRRAKSNPAPPKSTRRNV
jgi:hypothetical protein